MNDSVDKIIKTYFASMVVEDFQYKGYNIKSKALNVSSLLFRGLDCPEFCGGCCNMVLTLDWLPDEVQPENTQKREISFNGNVYTVHTIYPKKELGHCMNLDPNNGRCAIHHMNPFSCQFEIMRFLVSDEKASLMVRKYGRGWAMLKVTGERGAMCGITEFDEDVRKWLLHNLTLLKQWMVYFGLNPARPNAVIDWVKTGPHMAPIRFPAYTPLFT